ncbi:MAG: UDP-N-acetylglucosamine 2-epimerase (non-hydrolyzing) [Candidatus Hydrogenedentes bacterium]|nr:UDP-N-acetylglucosamine 2-epimerase (non-hydrolyzing) [Candidatus Hydrogenedentota bacterium]
MAPVIKSLQNEGVDVTVCLTGQHRELLDQVIRAFSLPVHYDLNIMSPGQKLEDITTRVITNLCNFFSNEKIDAVLVHGDTTTTLASAISAYYYKIPIGHVEAGLRTYDKYRPFPEEINRRLVDAIGDFLYAPTQRAKENLLSEHIEEEKILVTGNTGIDALLFIAEMQYNFEEEELETIGKKHRLIVVTAHRRENFGKPMDEIFMAVAELVSRNKDIEVLIPIHPNPNVLASAEKYLINRERIHLSSPLEYIPFVHILKKSYMILTDSGGIQEEAPSLGKPVLVLRDVTERPEAIEAGTAILVGPHYDRILETAQRLLDDSTFYKSMANKINPYGDGKSAPRIAKHLIERLKVKTRSKE